QQVTGTLDQAKSLILVITPGAVNAEAIRKEWRYARQQGVCVYPVKKEGNGKGVEFASLPLWMRRTNFYDVDQDWETFIRAVSSPYQAARVPFMPPDLPEGLVERPAELNQLKETLLNPDRRGANAVLWGPGGGGKSVLATAFCNDEDTINHFSDGILWASLGAEPNVQAELTKLYAALTGERPVFVDEDEAAMRLAERLGDRDYLMVIDGVCDAAHLKPFLRGGARCSRLVTTRNLNVITGADSKPETIAVGEMTTGEAVQMLAAQTEIPGDSKSVLEAIAQCLDKWPLLLKLFNVALQKRLNIDNNLEAAVNDLKQAFEKKGAVAFDQPEATDPNQAVAKSMSLSLARLTQDEQSHYIQLAFFPEDAEISLSEVGQLWEMEEFETKELVQHLGYHSLLKYDAENKTIHIFGVMRSFIVSQMPEQMGFEAKSEAAFKHILPEEQEIARRALLRLVRVAQPGEGDEDSRQRLKLTDFDPASQKVLKKLARVRLVTINPDDKSDEMIVQVADETFIKRWQRLHEWIDQDREFLLWRQQLRIKISEWENTDKDQGALLSGRPLAVARQWLKRHELDLNDAERSYINESARTETLLAENARRQRRSLQIQRWGVAVIALVFLASIVWGWWSYKRSNAELRKDADAAIGAIKKGNDELGVYENSLDKTSAEAASHLENAENNFRNAIENNPDLAEGYYGLGKVYKDRDKPEEALNYFTEAINRKPEHLGAYVNRGSIYLSQKRYPEAVKDYNEAIRLSPEDATLYNRRGTVYQQMNDPGLAEKDFVKAVTLKINYAEPYYHLGTIQAAAANYKQAKNNFDRASDYGYDGPEIFDEYLKLAKAFEAKYKDSGRTDKEAREGAVDSYTRLFNLTKDGKSPDLNVVAKKGVEDLGAAMPVSVRPTILIFFLEPDDATVYKEIINDLKKANKYFVQVVKGTNLSFDIPNGQVRYFHPEDEATASTVLNIVQNSLAQAGIRDKFDLIPSVEWGRRRNNLLGKIEVWIPPLPRYDVAPMGLLSN
ncbi:MAG TPA: tetratricopeptide repeat protein, partial [Pyrinomonadaceae bacterium]|nr:tetratricopeptide repeat protein [Pyrinomonadaceae bacterium]